MCDCDIRSCVVTYLRPWSHLSTCRRRQPAKRAETQPSKLPLAFCYATNSPVWKRLVIVHLALLVICSRPTYAITRRAMFWRLRARERSDESPRERMGTKNPPGIKPCQEKVSPWKEILQNLHEISQDLNVTMSCPQAIVIEGVFQGGYHFRESFSMGHIHGYSCMLSIHPAWF